MQMRGVGTAAVLALFCPLIPMLSWLAGPAGARQSLPDAPKPKTGKTQSKGAPPESAWPRTFSSGPDTFTIYPPQLDKWDGNLISLYSAVELKTGPESAPKYGVVWFEARTEVDKINRSVTLDQAKVTKVKFPAAQDKESDLTALLEKKLPGATRTVSLDRLEAELEADYEPVKGVDVKNDPPKVIIATKPSLQVLIDGTAQMREVPGTKLLRVINSRSIVLYETDKERYFLRVEDWWLEAKQLDGPWKYAEKLPDDMKKAEQYIVSQNQAQDPLAQQTKQQPSLKEAGKKAQIPAVYVVYGPAELVETKGEPNYQPIPGTALEYVVNTSDYTEMRERLLRLEGRRKGEDKDGRPQLRVRQGEDPKNGDDTDKDGRPTIRRRDLIE